MSRTDRHWRAVVPRDAAADTAVPAPTGEVAAKAPARVPAWAHATRPAGKTAAPSRPRRSPAALQPGDLQFLDSVRAAQQSELRPGTHAALVLMLALVLAAFAWAALTRVEQITRTDARVVPDGREQVIASLEGGILRELLVREGAAVRTGQPLLRMDPTRFESQQSEGQARRHALLASVARLSAEANGTPLQFPTELSEARALIASETEAFQARRKLLSEAVGANASGIALVQRELDMAEGMAGKGLMSEVEVMRLRRQIIELRQQSMERQNRFRQEASTEMLRIKAELAQLDEQMVARDDAVRRTVIASPVDGLVKNIRVNTVGGVIGAGAPIMEIVPQGARLRVEARIKPADIGFVRVGQHAEVKLSAFEYNLYGGLSGHIESISPDALGDADKPAGAADGTWFRALVAIDHSSLAAQGQPLPVIPGMTGSVEINTGERSVLDFILRPLLKAREAFRER